MNTSNEETVIYDKFAPALDRICKDWLSALEKSEPIARKTINEQFTPIFKNLYEQRKTALNAIKPI